MKLRDWCNADRAAFAAMNADADVMRYFPATQSRKESDASVDRCMARIKSDGFGFWAAELQETGAFIGFIGIQQASDYLPCAPATEIGWRLDKRYWGKGLAPEGARAALQYAFERLGISEVIAITSVNNSPSRRVMEKIGMAHDAAGDFDHPMVPLESPVSRHVLYRISSS
ncbi:GNAT family N-acetyltransferase [Kordiimonas aestuarii]|uniref:GNAT family N-acetyltransferase n=1 Tax=Kordiimonas aestuarii TaxID=1005925 RepID=UPI0021D00A04|nr:GNAT family N-acetyltransferase [Kordiimonas aestuarii]